MSASPSTHLIAEDLLLLLLDDRKGTISGSCTRTALGGAVLVEGVEPGARTAALTGSS
jgi:hypothetical protein